MTRNENVSVDADNGAAYEVAPHACWRPIGPRLPTVHERIATALEKLATCVHVDSDGLAYLRAEQWS